MNFQKMEKEHGGGLRTVLLEQIQKHKKLCLFGMGSFGKATADILQEEGFPISCFVDNNPALEGKAYNGIRCISFSSYIENKEDYYALITMSDPDKAFRQMKEHGAENFSIMISPYKLQFDKELQRLGIKAIEEKYQTIASMLEDERSRQVLDCVVKSWYQATFKEEKIRGGGFKEICDENQYFCKELVRLNRDTVFVDCGAFTGDSFERFVRNVPDRNFSKAILFELNEQNCRKLEENIKQNYPPFLQNRVAIISKGVSSENKTIYYTVSEGSSSIDRDGTRGEIVRMDDEIADEAVTMIKMDIEGSEIEALKGAEKLIQARKPILAVCVYHRLSDLWEIPLLIQKICPEYQIYFRHYTKTQIETVCYAIRKEKEG